nr:MAG TPA: portal protein [Caudoviricetes sp.]
MVGRQAPPRLQRVENGVTIRRDAGDDPRVLDSVYRALAILEGSISQLTLDRYSRTLGRPRGSATGMIQRILPGGQTLPGFLGEITQSLAQTGNAWLRVPDGPGPVRVLDPSRCSARIDVATGVKTITYDTLTVSDVRQLQLTHVPGEPLGQGPIQAWADGLRGAIDAHQYAAQWTKRGGRPTGILTTDQTLSADMAKEWKTAANATMTPEGGVAVLGSGLTYKQCYLTPAELQLLDVRKVNVISVARIFGIPARLMLTSGDGDSKTYANMEQESILFVRHTLMPYMREIEAALSELLPDDVRFNVDGFLRPDTTTRYAAHKVAIEAGFLTIDEVRAIEGLNPLPKEDEEGKEEGDADGEDRAPGSDPEPDPEA